MQKTATEKRCASRYCVNEPRSGRLCPKCRSRNYREKFPVKHAFLNLRAHAKERGIYFNLSFEYFDRFCKETNYIALRGIFKNDLTIDRIRPELGYVDGNLQALTNAENARKAQADKIGKGWGLGLGADFYTTKRRYRYAS